MQAQFKNGAHLKLRQLVAIARNFGFNGFHQFDVGSDFGDWPFAGDQRGACLGRAGRSANDADNFVQIGDGNNESKQQMCPFARFVQFELRSAGDDLFTEADERLDDIAQVEDLRPSAANGEHIGGEARLRLRMAPQLVQHHIGGRITLQIDDDAHALAAGFIANVGNTLDTLVLRGFGDFFDQSGFADLKRNAGQDDRATIAFSFLNLVAGALHDGALAFAIGRTCAAGAKDQWPSGEIRGRDDLDQLINGDGRVIDIGQAGLDNFAEIVRRDVGGHADGNTASAVHQQVGETCGQNLRFFAAAVIIGLEINRVFVEIIQQRVGDLVQPCFGVPHRCGRIRVHRSEVTLTIDQRHAHRPILRHTGKRIVNRAVAMRVIVAHDVADNLCRFAIWSASDKAAFLACEQYAAVNGLQAVTHVRQGAGYNDRHRIIEVARLHFIDDVDWRNVRWFHCNYVVAHSAKILIFFGSLSHRPKSVTWPQATAQIGVFSTAYPQIHAHWAIRGRRRCRHKRKSARFAQGLALKARQACRQQRGQGRSVHAPDCP